MVAGRSLWSVLMVTWLSAANASVSPPDFAANPPAAAEQERDGEAPAALTRDAPADNAVAADAKDASGAAS